MQCESKEMASGLLFSLRDELDRWLGAVRGGNGTWAPAVDMFEENGELRIEMELPGVEATDVEIQCHGLEVTVRALSAEPRAPQEAALQERRRGTYERTLTVSPDWSTRGTQASFKDGLLTLRIPEAPAPEGPRRINLELDRASEAEPERGGMNGAYRLGGAMLLPTMIGSRLDEDQA